MTNEERRSIELDGYEAANLEAAIKAVIAVNGDHPLSVFNSGDWICQILWKLEEWRKHNPADPHYLPNRTPEQYKAEAIKRSARQLEKRLADARRAALEEAASICESYKPGHTIEMTFGNLVKDPDGPWGLGSDFAAKIRAAGAS